MWADLEGELEEMFSGLTVLDLTRESSPGLVVRKSRQAIEAARKAYKAAWVRAKFRRDPEFRARKIAADLARYREPGCSRPRRLEALQIAVVRERLSKGEKQSVLAKEYGVGQSTISMIKTEPTRRAAARKAAS